MASPVAKASLVSFPVIRRAIRAMVRNQVLETPTARDIIRKSGFKPTLADVAAGEATILSVEGSRRVCFSPSGGVWPGGVHWAIDGEKSYVWGTNSVNTFGLDYTLNQALSPIIAAPNIDDAVKIAGSSAGTMILRSDGTVWASRLTGSPPAPNGGPFILMESGVADIDYTSAIAFAEAYYILKTDGTVWGRGEDLVGQGPSVTPTTSWAPDPNHFYQLPIGADVVDISCGGQFIAYRNADDTIGVWHYNRKDPVFPTDVPAGVTKMHSNAFSVHLLTDAGEIWTTGGNQRGEYGDSTLVAGTFAAFHQANGAGYTDVTGSNAAVFAIKDTELYSWGVGGYISARGGTAPNSNTPVQITSPHGDGWVSVWGHAANGATGFATWEDGCVYTWGAAFGTLVEEPTPLLITEGFPQFPLV